MWTQIYYRIISNYNYLYLKGGLTLTITIIDAPPGAGKSSWAFQEINSNPEKRYVFCTPYLLEIARSKNECGSRFKTPTYINNSSKINSFYELLSEKSCISVTHQTFLNASSDILDLIHSGHYTLILDESVDEAVSNFNDTRPVGIDIRQSINADDIKYLTEKTHQIIVHEDGLVEWIGDTDNGNFKYKEVQTYAKLNRLYCIDHCLLVIYPPDIFKSFDYVYILTYRFHSCALRYYFDKFGIKYEYKSIARNKSSQYSIVPYSDEYDKAFRRFCQKQITFCDPLDCRNDFFEGTALSKTWYQKSKANLKNYNIIQLELTRFFTAIVKKRYPEYSVEGAMWTCPKDFEKNVKGRGYKCLRKLTKEENRYPEKQKVELQKKLSRFVPCNARATNDYMDRYALAYCCNMYMQPEKKKFLMQSSKLGNNVEQSSDKISVSDDEFALSSLIQWIFRSRIRRGDTIVLLILSIRMKRLFTDWMKS